MTDIKVILCAHAARYPNMEPRDAVKLLYQATFGGGHILRDPEAAARFLSEERKSVEKREKALTEEIGGGYHRVYLDSKAGEKLSDAVLTRAFVLSNQDIPDAKELFSERLEALTELTDAGRMPFSPDELRAYLQEYHKAGYPMVSHTDGYREAYHPAYRVMKTGFARLLPVIEAIENAHEKTTVIVIDGRAASGKTTLAGYLKEFYPSAALIHMDDFFLPPALRTPERYREPGGNVDYDRFREEVSEKIGRGPFSYRRFDCSAMALADDVDVPDTGLIVIEGSYAMHPKLGLCPTAAFFSDVDPAEQLERIVLRNGEQGKKMFASRWIPLEEAYFEAFDCRGRADKII